jgi:hypothetical protein
MPTPTDICNLGLGKLGGAGDAQSGTAFIASIDGDDKVSQWCKINFPRVRRRVIIHLALLKSPFRITVKLKDLGAQIADDSLPEIGQWRYAFDLPKDCLEVTSQFLELATSRRVYSGSQSPVCPVTYRFETFGNKANDGKILVTDVFSNEACSSAFIDYVIDVENTGGYSEDLIDCIATLLSSEICPVVGRDMETANAQLVKYEQIVVPKAQAANQRGHDNTTKPIPDYSGGRSQGGVVPRRSTNLGTYLTANGNRESVQ